MVEAWAEKRVVISPDPAELAESVAATVPQSRRQARGRGQPRPYLAHRRDDGLRGAGGRIAQRTPGSDRLVARALLVERRAVRPPRRRRPQREQARAALLDALDIPAGEHPRRRGERRGHRPGCRGRTRTRTSSPASPADDGAWPAFDVCFLGVGPDGHIASLFPDRPEILITDRTRGRGAGLPQAASGARDA